ncbi:MAG: type VI secretion system tip protein TssI/VgrG [Pseudomonadota bacterium]|nr:type VI secretion system tip protein TssI/VgrG [Pseudomonadota bacterium]
MTAFKFEISNSEGDVEFSFEDEAIAAFWLAENLSGISPDLEKRSVNHGALNTTSYSYDGSSTQSVDTDISKREYEANWSPFTSSITHGFHDIATNDFNPHEQLTPPCRLRIRTTVDLTNMSPANYIGLPARLTIGCDEYLPRFFHGTIFRVTVLGGNGAEDAALEFLVCPWLWYLAYNKKSRIFSGTSLDIASQIIGDYPANLISAPSIDTSAVTTSLTSHDFVTQFGESDYAFISRLLERDGLFFYFAHFQDDYHLVVGEDNSSFLGDILDVVPIDVANNQLQGSELFSDYVTNLNLQRQIVPEQYRTRDYDADNATASLDAKSPSEDSALEVFEYPGGFEELADGLDNISPRRAKMLRSSETLCSGFGKHQLFMPGLKVAMPADPRHNVSTELLGATMLVRQTVHSLERSPVGLPVYKNAFDLMPIENDFSPAPITPRPTIKSPMTAIVTTLTSGETIDVDDTFRPMIRYKWDSDNRAIRVRLAQGWAGADHGMQILPRVGDEVLVEFLDGDIDRPVITGSLYNSASKALFDPTETNKISEITETDGQFRYVSGIHDAGGNQLLMYDQEGAEWVVFESAGTRDDMVAGRYLMASTDTVEVTKNDKVEDVLNDYTLYIGGNLKVDVVGDVRFVVGGSILSYEAEGPDDVKRK